MYTICKYAKVTGYAANYSLHLNHKYLDRAAQPSYYHGNTEFYHFTDTEYNSYRFHYDCPFKKESKCNHKSCKNEKVVECIKLSPVKIEAYIKEKVFQSKVLLYILNQPFMVAHIRNIDLYDIFLGDASFLRAFANKCDLVDIANQDPVYCWFKCSCGVKGERYIR